MKYIRTKDGVYDLKLKPKYENDQKTIDFFVNTYYGGYNNFVKGGDTIEELCDKFVFRVGEYVMIDKDEDRIFRGNWKCYDSIYGAIWTDKGLIYVAQMNESGVLELI